MEAMKGLSGKELVRAQEAFIASACFDWGSFAAGWKAGANYFVDGMVDGLAPTENHLEDDPFRREEEELDRDGEQRELHQ